MNLYEMTSAARELYELLLLEEIDENTFNDTLEAMGTEEKLESYCKIIRQYQEDSSSIKAEIDRLEAAKLRAERNIVRMKGAVKQYLDALGQKKAKAGTFLIYTRKNSAVSITDEKLIPEEFLTPQAPKISRNDIKKALLYGQAVPGAELTPSESIIIK